MDAGFRGKSSGQGRCLLPFEISHKDGEWLKVVDESGHLVERVPTGLRAFVVGVAEFARLPEFLFRALDYDDLRLQHDCSS